MANPHEPFAYDEETPSSSFQPLVRRLWSYRRVMALALMALFVVVLGTTVVAFMIAPKERLATIGFRLTFEGAEQDRFPNGTRFSSGEIVSSPVLTEVYRINDLSRYLPFNEFEESMFVLQSNADLDLLSSEYQSKLADSKLTPVDRSRLEEEYRQKRESLKSAQFSLNFQRTEGAVKMPPTVMTKALNDTLVTWEKQAVDYKGAVRLDMPLLSKNVLQKDFLAAEDYVIAVDILRTKAEQVLMNIADYGSIPGAATVRIGEEQLSLAEVRNRLEDVLRFKVEPLFGLIRASGVSRDPAAIERYFEGRLFQLQLAREEAAQRVRSRQEAFREYLQRRGPLPAPSAPGGGVERGGTVMPQLSESFLDRLLEMSNESDDLEFRQELTKRIIAEGETLAHLTRQTQYYESMRRAFGGARGAVSTTVAARVTAATDRAYADIAKAVDQVGELYKRIAEQHLNPTGALYAITSPYSVRTVSSLPLQTALRYAAAAMFLGLFLIPIACLVHAYVRDSLSAASNSVPAPREKPSKQFTGV